MDMDKLAAKVTARRAAAGLIALNGVACPTQEWKDYYDARHLAPRDREGFAVVAPALRELKARAIASVSN